MSLAETTILVLGESGQLASSFADLRYRNIAFAGQRRANFAEPQRLALQLEQIWQYRPFRILINTAAYTNVDGAEKERALALNINAISVGVLAAWCKSKNIYLVHYSTDYVFSGQGVEPWTEESSPAPLNYYGETKWLGEQSLRQSGAAACVLRTSWVHSPYGVNFVKKMLSLYQREELRIVNDQIGSPTYAPHLAAATMALLSKIWAKFQIEGVWAPKFETFNVTNAGYVSWYEFASEIFHKAVEMEIIPHAPQLTPVTTQEYKSAAARPLNSRLAGDKFQSWAQFLMPSWSQGMVDGLHRFKLEG